MSHNYGFAAGCQAGEGTSARKERQADPPPKRAPASKPRASSGDGPCAFVPRKLVSFAVMLACSHSFGLACFCARLISNRNTWQVVPESCCGAVNAFLLIRMRVAVFIVAHPEDVFERILLIDEASSDAFHLRSGLVSSYAG